MGIYFDERGEVRDSAVLIVDVKRLIDTFLTTKPSLYQLRAIDGGLQTLKDKKIPYDFSNIKKAMLVRVSKILDPRIAQSMVDIIESMHFVSDETPFAVTQKLVANKAPTSFIKEESLDDGWNWKPWNEHILPPGIVPAIVKIIVNDQTTIVIWKDGTKTLVRPTKDDKFDLDAAVCAAIAKKLYGTNSALKKDIRKKVVYQDNKKKKEEG